jgi:hypothetical protein
MQLEDERRHADQYKEQVEKVCICTVPFCALDVCLCLPSLPLVPAKQNCRVMVQGSLFSCPFICVCYFIGVFS